MERTEEIIIERLRAGEEQAYRYLFIHHYPVMCHIAAQYVHDDFLAETIASDIILHIWEKRGSLKVVSSLRSYLTKAVRNRCLDFLRSQYQQHEYQTSNIKLPDLTFIRYLQSDDFPLGRMLSDELENFIADAIERLPKETKRVFKLSRFEQKRQEDIAAELGISINTVKYHIRQALALLRTDLSHYLALWATLVIQGQIWLGN